MPDVEAPAATVTKTTETKETTAASTEASAAVVISPPPPTVADDNARKWLAGGVVAQFLLIVGYIIYATVAKEATNAEMIVLGAENVFMGSVLNYYFGSSSGSTQKTAQSGK